VKIEQDVEEMKEKMEKEVGAMKEQVVSFKGFQCGQEGMIYCSLMIYLVTSYVKCCHEFLVGMGDTSFFTRYLPFFSILIFSQLEQPQQKRLFSSLQRQNHAG
jgi:hypothetical protein